jgi:acyl-CoA thioester hydrolase
MIKYEKEIEVRWADCDANRHVRHSAYYDYGAHVRIRFFEEFYGADKMQALAIGPILFKEECNFIREIRSDDIIRVNFLKGQLNEDASRWILYHEIYDDKGEKKAHLKLTGAWMDLNKRKLCIPPAEIAKFLHDLPQGEDYVYKK